MDGRCGGTNASRMEVLCKVCGDKASGKHYGVASCDGCRGFFKRSIRRNLEYVCKENGRCIVDVTRRNQCQACRFRKCLQVNMKKDAVQHERAPRSCMPAHSNHQGTSLPGHLLPLPFPTGGLARRLHGSFFTAALPVPSILGGYPLISHHNNAATGLTDPNTALGSANHLYFNHGIVYPSTFTITQSDSFRSKGSVGAAERIGSSTENTNPVPTRVSNDDEVSSSEEPTPLPTVSSSATDVINKNLLHLHGGGAKIDLTADHPVIRPFITRPLGDVSCMTMLPIESVYESAAKLLFLSVKWARTIPSFLQLSCNDQNTLLEEAWAELFILTAAQWALPIDEGILVENVSALTSKHLNLQEDARKLRETINRLNSLQIDHTEYACLKALVLFKSDCRNLCDPTHVELLQDQTHVMLQEYCSSPPSTLRFVGNKRSMGTVRFGKLLLALPAVQIVSRRSLEELLFKKTVGDVAIERLLFDMVKSSSQ